jgi:hypothetical protein
MAIAAAIAISASPAAAQSCKAPPGMSAIDQYCEAIPGAAGDRGNSDLDRGGLPIPAATQRALARSGPDGRAVIGLSAASAKQGSGKGHRGAGAGVKPATGPDRPAEAPSSNPIAALAAGVTDGATVSPLLGTVMLFLALVFFGTAWLRYRRRLQS